MEYWCRPRLYVLLLVANSHHLPADLSDTASDEQCVAVLGGHHSKGGLKGGGAGVPL